MRPVSLYVHIPYCPQKCGYCDFNSYAFSQREDHEAYVDALEREMALWAARLGPDVTVPTVFIGGGTPTLLPAGLLERVIRRVFDFFPVQPGAEFTLEANPGTVDVADDKLARARAAGANRISFGVQAFQDHLLRRLGRVHTVEEVYQAVAAARAAGFANLNLDLMYGLPGQTPADFRESLGRAVALGPEHISAYSLILEEGTGFWRLHQQGLLPLPDEDTEEEMDRLARELLPAAGYERYEISNYARPGFRCRHNLVYWRNGEYLGLGAGAHSCLQLDPPLVRRFWNEYRPADYVAALRAGRLPVAGGEDVDLPGQMAETVILGLRTLDGVDAAAFAARFGRTLDQVYGPVAEGLVRRGLLETGGDAWRLTPRGLRLANQVWSEFLP